MHSDAKNSNMSCTGRQTHYQSIVEAGQKLRSEGQMASKAIGARISGLQEKRKKMVDMASTRRARLEEAAYSQQVHWFAIGMVAHNCIPLCASA